MHTALWSISQQLVRQAFVLLFMLVVARSVSPYEFGLVGIANIYNNFLTLFLELGFTAALVQRKEISDGEIASAAVLNLLSGAAIMVLSIALAGPVSMLLKAPEAKSVIVALSVSFLVTALASPQIAIAQRNFRFKQLAIRDFLAQIVAATVGIVLATLGYGVWAVVAHSLLVNLVFVAGLWSIHPAPIRWTAATFRKMREISAFGCDVLGYSALKYLVRTADSLLVGMLFGPEKLGLYNFAQRVAAAPTKAIQTGLGAYLFPKASSAQEHPEKVKALFFVSFKILNYLLLNFGILLFAIGTDLISVVFGKQWQTATGLLALFFLIQLLAPAVVPMAELAKAARVPNLLVRWSIWTTLATTGALVIGSLIGFNASIICFVAAWFLTLPMLASIIRSIVPFGLGEFWRAVRASYLLPLASSVIILLVGAVLAPNTLATGALAGIIIVSQLAIVWRTDSDLRKIGLRIVHRLHF